MKKLIAYITWVVFLIARNILIISLLAGCKKYPDMSLAQIEDLLKNNQDTLIEKSISKPYESQEFLPGEVGGSWHGTLLSEPKTFNQIIAERDAYSNNIIEMTTDYLVEYDMTKRKWIPHAASFDIETDKARDKLVVHYTIRDDLYWSYYNKSEKIPVTSDDYVFWYNEIAGDSAFASSGYAQQQVPMKDGTTAHIDCVKISDKKFDFIFPRIVADPLLATNMSCCPSFIYKKAKDEGGVEGVKNIFASNVDVKTIPSCGKWYISEYTPAQRLVASRNQNYWEKDLNNVSIPYPKEQIFHIVGDVNTEYLLFKQGKIESFTPTPENISDVIAQSNNDYGTKTNVNKNGYSVYNSGGSLGAQFISFNQNPCNSDEPYYKWFCKKEFRQAISCLINRKRLIDQSYRGLALPKYDLFPDANPYYNPKIEFLYKYDTAHAVALLESCGITRDKDNIMRDSDNNKIEFNLTVPSSSPVTFDIALIIADECSKIGITVNIRQTDFQKMVEMLTSTYDWQSIILALGANIFPSQGSNVWPTYGNLHLWNPLQKTPATAWEARFEYLYTEGCYCADEYEAKIIWDEFQRVFLEECPMIYLVCPRSFYAISNRWDLRNFYFDNKNGAKTDWVFLRQ